MELEFHQLDLRYEGLRVRRPDRERRLLSSLADRGQQVPIVVIALAGEPNRFLVIDGYKRIRALKRIGRDTVMATVWDMNETEALVLDRSQRTAEGETALEQGWLLDELHRSFGLSFDDLARRFDRSISWVSRRLALVQQLPEPVQQHVRNGKIGAWAAMKHLVPMARANRYACERLADEIARNKFSTSEVGQIYAAWSKGSLNVKNSIINDPKLFLRARREIEEEEPVVVRSAEELLRNLDIIGAMSRRAARQWQEAAGSMDVSERENVQLCLKQAIADLTKLSDKIERGNDYVKSESENSNPGASPKERWQPPDCACAQSVAFSGQESNSLGIACAAADCPPGESGTIPSGDPGVICFLQGEPGPSP
jgi:ParB family transcriptional regulator, chromosome partitioning protein